MAGSRPLSIFILIRPVSCVLSFMAALIGGFLLIKSVSEPLLLASLSALFMTAGGAALHDYFDFSSDRLSRPRRPLPSGHVKPSTAVFLSAALLFSGIVISFAINIYTAVIVLINLAVIIAYTGRFQGRVIIGNCFIGYLSGSTFIHGGLSVMDAATGTIFLLPAVFLGVIAMLSNFSRGVVKDLDSVKRGRMGLLKILKAKVKLQFLKLTGRPSVLPIDYTNKTERELVAAALVITILLSFIPFKIGLYGHSYMVLAGLGDLGFVWAIYTLWLSGEKKYRKAGIRIKTGMLLVMLGFLAGVFL